MSASGNAFTLWTCVCVCVPETYILWQTLSSCLKGCMTLSFLSKYKWTWSVFWPPRAFEVGARFCFVGFNWLVNWLVLILFIPISATSSSLHEQRKWSGAPEDERSVSHSKKRQKRIKGERKGGKMCYGIVWKKLLERTSVEEKDLDLCHRSVQCGFIFVFLLVDAVTS